MPQSSYKLLPLSDVEFNVLSESNKLLVADKLLSSLFFGYPLSTLKEKIASASFMHDIAKDLKEELVDKCLVSPRYGRQVS